MLDEMVAKISNTESDISQSNEQSKSVTARVQAIEERIAQIDSRVT